MFNHANVKMVTLEHTGQVYSVQGYISIDGYRQIHTSVSNPKIQNDVSDECWSF